MRNQKRDFDPGKCWIDVRMSKDEIRGASATGSSKTTEEKLNDRMEIAQNLARTYDVIVPPENVIREVVSGKDLAKRQRFAKLIAQCPLGNVQVLFTPYVDRLTRGDKGEEAYLERMFKQGKTLVVTTEGVFDFGDPSFDSVHGLNWSMRNMVNRQYLNDTSKKYKESNLSRIRRGKRNSGEAPHGFAWNREIIRNGRLIEAAHYDHTDDYPVIVEIFRRIWDEGPATITADLSRRFRETGHPAPPEAEDGWNRSTVFSIVKNPFYAGYPAHRFQNQGVSTPRKNLAIGDWILPTERVTSISPDADPGEFWPISLEDFYNLQNHIAQRKNPGEPKSTDSLMTGILVCENGRPMINKKLAYTCTCKEKGDAHCLCAVSQPKIEDAVVTIIEQCIRGLPDDLITHRSKPFDRNQAVKSIARKQIALNKARGQIDDLMRNRTSQIELFGQADYEKAAKKVVAEARALESEIDTLREEVNKPDTSEVMSVLRAIKDVGLRVILAHGNLAERRKIIRAFVKRVQIAKALPGQRYVSELHYTYQDWVTTIAPFEAVQIVQQTVYRRDKPKPGFNYRIGGRIVTKALYDKRLAAEAGEPSTSYTVWRLNAAGDYDLVERIGISARERREQERVERRRERASDRSTATG